MKKIQNFFNFNSNKTFLKPMNELFDSQELKDIHEIDILRKSIPLKKIISDSNTIKGSGNSFIQRISFDCPFIETMTYFIDMEVEGKKIDYSLEKSKHFTSEDGKKMKLFFIVDIFKFRSYTGSSDPVEKFKYSCSIMSGCVNFNDAKYEISTNDTLMGSSFKDLSNFLNKKGPSMINDLNKKSNDMFGEVLMPDIKSNLNVALN